MRVCNQRAGSEYGSLEGRVFSSICQLMRLVVKTGKPQRTNAAHTELAALSPWLKKDLGVSPDGEPLDYKKR